jgi:Ca2+-binding RTX toxin-like protein
VADKYGTPGNDTLIGTATNDTFYLEGGIDSVVGGAGTDVVIHGDDGQESILRDVERVLGGLGPDRVRLVGSGATLSVSSIEELIGSSGIDDVRLEDGDNVIQVSGIERLRGGVDGIDNVTLVEATMRMTVGQIEQLQGSAEGDWILLDDEGNSLQLSGIETLIGGAGADQVQLGGNGNSLILAAVETITGGLGDDWVNIGNRGSTMTIGGVETLIGGTGFDSIAMVGSGTIILAAIDLLIGDDGEQHVNLGNRGVTLEIQNVETLIGGARADSVTLGGYGQTLILTAVETLFGSAGGDYVTLGNRGNTMSIANVETVIGGIRSDALTVTAGGIHFQGNGQADSVTLATASADDTIVFAASTDGAAAGAVSGFDTITNFQRNVDKVEITGTLFEAVDRDGDAVLGSRSLSTQIDFTRDELVVVTGKIDALADSDFTALRTALGRASASGAGSVLVMANDGTDSALYSLTDTAQDRVIAAGDISMLAKFKGVLLSATDVTGLIS